MSQAGTDTPFFKEGGTTIRLGGDDAAFLALRYAWLVEKWHHANTESQYAPPWHGRNCVNTYYDTPERKLLQEKACLRLDQTDETFSQYFSSGYKQSDTPLRSPDYFPIMTGKKKSSLYGLKNDLSPFMRLSYRHYSCDIVFGDTSLNISVQQGQIKAWAPQSALRERPFKTVALTHQKGSLEGFYEFTKALVQECGLLFDRYSPAALGHALAYNAILPMRPSRPTFMIEGGPITFTIEQVIARALISARHQIEDGCSLLMADDPRGVKTMRVGIRRLRALERAFKPTLDCPTLRHYTTIAKAFSHHLGEARDLDILAHTTLPAIARQAPTADADNLHALARFVAKQHAAKQHQLDDMVRSPEFTGFLISLTQYSETKAWRESMTEKQLTHLARTDIPRFSARILDRQLKKVQRTGAELDVAPIDASHPLRIEVKKLRYAAQALRGFYEKETRTPYMQALSHLQDIFGAMNDAQVSLELTHALVMEKNHAAIATRLQPDYFSKEKERQEHHQYQNAWIFLKGWYARGLEQHAEEVYDAWKALKAMPPFWRK